MISAKIRHKINQAYVMCLSNSITPQRITLEQRELFKPIKDLASLWVCNAKILFFCEWHHKWNSFGLFGTLHLALGQNCWSRGSQPGVHVRQGYICLSEGVHLRLAIDEKMYLHKIYFQIFIHISAIIIFKNHNTLIVKYIYEKSC